MGDGGNGIRIMCSGISSTAEVVKQHNIINCSFVWE
jgi:hypothetical protein